MNIDLLPFSAFALESLGPADPGRSDGHTLTLELGLAPARSSHEPMSGIASANQAFSCATPLRAAVLPTDGPVLTITF
jgi:hypothetical protein